jgi:hypothetical protein
MLTATDGLINSLDKWITAIKKADFAKAKFHAERLQLDGALLSLRPEFKHAFGKRCPNLDAAVLLSDFGQFLLCTTECREQALKNPNGG